MTYLDDQVAELEGRVTLLEDQIRMLTEIVDELVTALDGEDEDEDE